MIRVRSFLEIRRIATIVEQYARDHEVDEHDRVFVERLRVNRGAFSFEHWRGHFELEGVLSYPELKGHLLDFGCGSGHLDVLLAQRGRRVHGLDLSDLGIRIAEHLRRRQRVSVAKRITFQRADVTSASVPRLFDAVWACHVFEHVRDPGPVLEGLRRWAPPGAPLLVAVPWRHAHDDPGHVHHFMGGEALAGHLGRHVDVERVDTCEEHKVLRALCRL